MCTDAFISKWDKHIFKGYCFWTILGHFNFTVSQEILNCGLEAIFVLLTAHSHQNLCMCGFWPFRIHVNR